MAGKAHSIIEVEAGSIAENGCPVRDALFMINGSAVKTYWNTNF